MNMKYALQYFHISVNKMYTNRYFPQNSKIVSLMKKMFFLSINF